MALCSSGDIAQPVRTTLFSSRDMPQPIKIPIRLHIKVPIKVPVKVPVKVPIKLLIKVPIAGSVGWEPGARTE